MAKLDKSQICSFFCIFYFSKPFDSSNILHVFLHHLAKNLAKKQNFVLFQRFGNFFENRGNPLKIRESKKRARRGRRALCSMVALQPCNPCYASLGSATQNESAHCADPRLPCNRGLTIFSVNHHWKLRNVTCKKHLKSFCKQVHIL